MEPMVFAKENLTPIEETVATKPWRLLIVDDEHDVHRVTEIALANSFFQNRSVELLHAYSAEEAQRLLDTEQDIAVILLDVVMEAENSGLKLVQYIREQQANKAIRIVLRTGQPGQAPEREIIHNYDINDYKSKTELTAAKLDTIICASIRSYQDIIRLEQSTLGLEKLINSSRRISTGRGLNSFVMASLEQLTSLLDFENNNLTSCETQVFKLSDANLEVFSSHSDDQQLSPITITELSEDTQNVVKMAIDMRANAISSNTACIYCSNKSHIFLFYLKTRQDLTELDAHLLNIFTENLIVLLENIRLNELITDSQREVIYRLGEVVESRSEETGNHVKRVAYYSELLAQLVGLSDEEANFLKLASPLHDIGKIGIPDSILKKKGKLTPDEWTIMKTHAERGHRILVGSDMMLMQMGATIALTHHEKWDGSGYPNGLTGTNIHLYGRITAIADVFDALGSERCYKKAWPLEDILELMREESGKHFDPRLISLMLNNLDRFLDVRERFQDV